MRVKFERRNGERHHWSVRVEIEQDGKKPVVVTLAPDQVDLVMQLLQAAKNAQVFCFEVDL